MPRLHGIKVPGEDAVFIIRIPDGAIDDSPTPEQALLLKMDLRIAQLKAEIERLRGLLTRFMEIDNNHHPDRSYAVEEYIPNETWECRFCENVWERTSHENHADDCPVVLARVELESAP